MKILGVIPARYASTRFEGKPLKDICGHSMIEWVYKRAKNADIDGLVVATDDKRIFEAVKKFGGNVVMTAENHQNGTSRIVEVINKDKFKNIEIFSFEENNEELNLDFFSLPVSNDKIKVTKFTDCKKLYSFNEKSFLINFKELLENLEKELKNLKNI